jgi:hypothetical protein
MRKLDGEVVVLELVIVVVGVVTLGVSLTVTLGVSLTVTLGVSLTVTLGSTFDAFAAAALTEVDALLAPFINLAPFPIAPPTPGITESKSVATPTALAAPPDKKLSPTRGLFPVTNLFAAGIPVSSAANCLPAVLLAAICSGVFISALPEAPVAGVKVVAVEPAL